MRADDYSFFDSDSQRCYLLVDVDTDIGFWYLGSGFLANKLVLFDLEEERLGFIIEDTEEHSGSGLSRDSKIIVGCVVGAFVVALITAVLVRRRKKRAAAQRTHFTYLSLQEEPPQYH